MQRATTSFLPCILWVALLWTTTLEGQLVTTALSYIREISLNLIIRKETWTICLLKKFHKCILTGLRIGTRWSSRILIPVYGSISSCRIRMWRNLQGFKIIRVRYSQFIRIWKLMDSQLIGSKKVVVNSLIETTLWGKFIKTLSTRSRENSMTCQLLSIKKFQFTKESRLSTSSEKVQSSQNERAHSGKRKSWI